MNSRQRRLEYIRYKNQAKKKGFCLPKWKLESREWPYKWVNMHPGLLEEKWIIDLRIQ